MKVSKPYLKNVSKITTNMKAFDEWSEPHLRSSQVVRPDTVNVATVGSNPTSSASTIAEVIDIFIKCCDEIINGKKIHSMEGLYGIEPIDYDTQVINLERMQRAVNAWENANNQEKYFIGSNFPEVDNFKIQSPWDPVEYRRVESILIPINPLRSK